MNFCLDSRFFPFILDAMPVGVFTVGVDRRITWFNAAAERMLGYERSEVIGQRCYEIFRADQCRQNCPLLCSMRTLQVSEDRDVVMRAKDGKRIPVAVSTAALRGEDGELMGGVEMFRDLSHEEALRKELKRSFVVEDIVSKNPTMQKVLRRLPLFARSQSTVLIEGPSGTGKELIAEALHNLSARSQMPLVKVNCGALPEGLLESELFGYVRGAFTDAKRDKPGRFALADRGAIFLDEIGEISPAVQVKLLRVLQERSFEPLGGTRSHKVDVRVIAATNRRLEEEVRARRFREDLYYRLNVIRIELPPLSDRPEDIPLLVDHFIQRFNRFQGREVRGISEAALSLLMRSEFPGHIRELENAIEYAFVLCQERQIDVPHLPPRFQAGVGTGEEPRLHAERGPLMEAERREIAAALARCRFHREKTARLLGISRNTLWRKMKRLNMLDE